jgi:hypothetical protein
MHDDLPEIFEQLKPPVAPPRLRPRVLSAVNSELAKRRKPRWERVLERAAVVLFVVGVGMNVWQFSQPDVITVIHQQQAPPTFARRSGLLDHELEQSLKGRKSMLPGSRDPEASSAEYHRLLAEVSKQPAG